MGARRSGPGAPGVPKSPRHRRRIAKSLKAHYGRVRRALALLNRRERSAEAPRAAEEESQ
jgi:hypothetical protein